MRVEYMERESKWFWKNRQIVEVTRALLFQMRMFLRGDAVLTACYLINRMPSSVLDGQSPHSVLFPYDPPFPLPPPIS